MTDERRKAFEEWLTDNSTYKDGERDCWELWQEAWQAALSTQAQVDDGGLVERAAYNIFKYLKPYNIPKSSIQQINVEIRAAIADAIAALPTARQGVADYNAALADHRRLVREIDVIINGVNGAAKQASLCDLVGQIRELVALSTTKPREDL